MTSVTYKTFGLQRPKPLIIPCPTPSYQCATPSDIIYSTPLHYLLPNQSPLNQIPHNERTYFIPVGNSPVTLCVSFSFRCRTFPLLLLCFLCSSPLCHSFPHTVSILLFTPYHLYPNSPAVIKSYPTLVTINFSPHSLIIFQFPCHTKTLLQVW